MMKKNRRWWDLPAAFFLLGALFVAAVRLHSTNWTEHLGRMEFNVLIAAVLGFALGKSAFKGRTTFLFGLIYSLFFLPWQLCLILPDLEWPSRLSILYARLWYATADFLANKPVKDPILFLSAMFLLYWFASLLSTYHLVRRVNPWVPLLALGGMILVIEYTMEMYRYAKIPGSTYSLVYLVFCLLLMGRIYFLRSKRDWEARGGTVEMEVGYDLGRGVAVAAVVLALVAWNAPQVVNFFESSDPARERVTRSWEKFRDRISKAANSLRSPSPVIIEGYGNNMFLGTGGNRGEEVVLTVRPTTGRQTRRFYWTARTYDRYQNGQWSTTISDSQAVGPGQSAIVYPSWHMHREIQMTFNSRVPLLKTIYYISEPLNLSREAQAIVSVAEDGATDLNAIMMDPPLKSGEEYTVRATIVQPTVLALRESSEEYPDWIAQRYLQIPEDFSPEIITLARQIAGEEPTPYDKAMAITQYLRRTITYTLTVPDLPVNQEPLEWFLFDQRAGFCNYYASAEVMMLRALGVPARIVVGYAQGAWDPETEEYVVLGKDSHAWPEVYFPEYGWVTFEPTVSQPVTEYPQGEVAQEEQAAANPNVNAEPTFDPFSMMNRNDSQFDPTEMEQLEQPGPQVRPWLIAAMVGLVILAVLVFLEWRRRRIEDLPFASWLERALDERGFRTPGWLRMWSRRSLRTPMENLFANVAWMLKVWGHPVESALTPAEQVAILVNVIPGTKSQALVLLEEYQRAMYSQYAGNTLRARVAVRQLKGIGYRNWVLRLVGFEA